jgi:type I restriction enzyme, S subunit
MRPYLRAANVTWRGLDLRDVKEMNFTEDESAAYELRPGDVLVAEASGSADEVGKPALWRGELDSCCFQNTLIRVRTLGPLPEYLRYFVLAEAQSGRIGRASPGVGIHHIGAARLAAWRVLVPPLAEQRRIVVAIEEQLSRLDAAVSQVDVANERLRMLRSRVVDSAIAGPWLKCPFNDVIQSLRNGVFVSRPDAHPPGIPIFRISAVRPMALDVDDVRYAPAAEPFADESFVRPGDLLFTRYSGNPAYVGACAVVPPRARRTLHPDKLIRVTVDRERSLPEYIEIAFASTSVRREVEVRLKTTAGQVGIAGGQLRTVPVPLPPLEVQRQIVARVRVGLSAADALSSALNRASLRAETLRRSILARAFRGELVAQDPSDEPASALLDRIATERGAAPAPTRERRVRTRA